MRRKPHRKRTALNITEEGSIFGSASISNWLTRPSPNRSTQMPRAVGLQILLTVLMSEPKTALRSEYHLCFVIKNFDSNIS